MLPGAFPVGRNSTQRCVYRRYAEQTSGSLFTAPRAVNERSRPYRVRPTSRSTTACCRTARTEASEAASAAELKPHELKGTMALLFEMRLPEQVTA